MKKRAFVKHTKSGKIIPGSLVVTTKGGYPQDGLYQEVSTDLCCTTLLPDCSKLYGGRIPVTYTGISAENKPYDGNTLCSIIGTVVLVGVLPEDVGNLVLTENPFGNFNFIDSSIGTNKMCFSIGAFYLDGPAVYKYILVDPIYYADILPV